jgi:6-phosphogluconolactonase (cycloisomerase 2 family)
MTPPTVNAGNQPYCIVVHPSGKYVYVANVASYTISQYTVGINGALSPMIPPSVNAGTSSIAVQVDASGKFLYAVNAGDNNISQYSIGNNGALTPLNGSNPGTDQSPFFFAVIDVLQ